ncbi:hypothetical protein [Dyella sp.]|uniref:hypothetical protein n=1 Tax=Dyella sp. TaxID=1869338 RepID=UPI002ED22ADC
MSVAELQPLAEPLLETTRRMIGTLQRESSTELRLALAKRILRQLGDEAYPVFLKLLLIVAESEDAAAKQLVADLLASAAQRMDLPSGALSAWGGSHTATASPYESPSASGAMGRRRLLGPIEYLTVWYCQQTQRPMLEESLYADAIGKLIGLFDLNPVLRQLYAEKLAGEAGNELEGTYSCETRQVLSRLAERWKKPGVTPLDVVRAAIGGELSATAMPPGWIVHRL